MSDKSALKSLTEYGVDSDSEDDVPSGRVSVKRVQRFENEDTNARKVNRLPTPNINCKHLVEAEERPSEENSRNDGKVRSFAHERGNWATYVFVPFDPDLGMTTLLSKLTQTASVDLKQIDHFHISLSKTVILRHHWIDSLIDDVRNKIAIIKSFVICFDGLAVYKNEEKTRTFLGLKIKSGFDPLAKLVSFVDDSLMEFNLQTFYKTPSFHMSIAWTVGDKETYFNEILPELNALLQEVLEEHPEEFTIFVNNIQCKCGNKLFNFNLT